jgi:hypothetical protein
MAQGRASEKGGAALMAGPAKGSLFDHDGLLQASSLLKLPA